MTQPPNTHAHAKFGFSTRALWADRFDGGLEDGFNLQDQVTASVVGAIAPRLGQAEIDRAKRKPTESLDAYDYFLRGMANVHRWTREANDEALQNFPPRDWTRPGIRIGLWLGRALLLPTESVRMGD